MVTEGSLFVCAAVVEHDGDVVAVVVAVVVVAVVVTQLKRPSVFLCVFCGLSLKPAVVVSPLPCSGVMICRKCPLIISGRRFACLSEDSPAPSLRRPPASKQATSRSNYIFQASVKHLVGVT